MAKPILVLIACFFTHFTYAGATASLLGTAGLSTAELSATDEHLVPSELRDSIDDIRDVQKFVEQLMERGVSPHEIAVIFDVDGTLSSNSIASEFRKTGSVSPRDGAIEVVRNLHAINVHLIASSACSHFLETVEKLRYLDLLNVFFNEKNKEVKRDQETVFPDTQGNLFSFIYSQAGRVISVRSKEKRGSYLRKAFSLSLGLNEGEFHSIKHVIFVDDRAKYVEIFDQDMQKFRPLGHSVEGLTYFNLTDIPKKKSKRALKDSAGVLVYSKIDTGETYILLGQEKYHKSVLPDQQFRWNFMRGAVESGSTYIETAARELHEESAGVIPLMTKDELIHFPHDQYDNEEFDPSWPNHAITFFVPIRFERAKTFRVAAKTHSDRHFREMSDYRWMNARDLRELLESAENRPFSSVTPSEESVTIELQDFSFRVLKHAYQNGVMADIFGTPVSGK